MKFCKLGINEKFIEKTVNFLFFAQLANGGTFEEF